MSLGDSIRRGLYRLRHLGETTEARGEEMAAQAGRFHRLAREDSAPRVVSAFNLFQTPEPIADEMAAAFAGFGRTLEPSAGLGRLYRAVRRVDPGCHVTLIDNAPDCCRELYHATEGDGAARLVQADFLALTVEELGEFDAVIMNPPFCRGEDIQHIEHALTLLAPGGRLVALCADSDRRRQQFADRCTRYRTLPPRSFKSEGTSVAAAVVVFDRSA